MTAVHGQRCDRKKGTYIIPVPRRQCHLTFPMNMHGQPSHTDHKVMPELMQPALELWQGPRNGRDGPRRRGGRGWRRGG